MNPLSVLSFSDIVLFLFSCRFQIILFLLLSFSNLFCYQSLVIDLLLSMRLKFQVGSLSLLSF